MQEWSHTFIFLNQTPLLVGRTFHLTMTNLPPTGLCEVTQETGLAAPDTAHFCVHLCCQATVLLQVSKFIKSRQSCHLIFLSNCKRGGRSALFLDPVCIVSILTPHQILFNEISADTCPDGGGVTPWACPVVLRWIWAFGFQTKSLFFAEYPWETFQDHPSGVWG